MSRYTYVDGTHLTIVRRRIKVNTREILIRLKAFRGFMFAFFIITSISSFFLRVTYGLSPIHSYYEAITMLFYASSVEYPEGNIPMEIFFVTYPLLGIFLIIDGLSGIGASIKFGDPTSEIYNREMAALFSNHICIVGVGHLGVRVVNRLKDTNEDIVVIEKPSSSKPLEGVLEDFQRSYRVPIIRGDATYNLTMEEANVEKARMMMILIDDDLLNLKIAIRARKINPGIDLVLRIFDEELGRNIGQRLNATILSTTRIATPSFIGRIPKLYQSERIKRQNHLIIVGMGKLGRSIINEIKDSEEIVVIDDDDIIGDSESLTEWGKNENIDVIIGNATLERTLNLADIKTARAILVLVGEDVVGLKIALLARELNPDIELILRMYDDPLAEDTSTILQAKTLSTTKIAVKEFLFTITR